MARVCTVIAASHSPFLFTDSEQWEPGRATRLSRGGLSPETKVDTVEENAAKYARIKAAYGKLREKLEASKPDVLLVFGDDQLEQFNFKNFPALAMFTGEAYSGYKISRWVGLPVGPKRPEREKNADTWVTVKSYPELSHALMRELMQDGFDLAFSNELEDPEEGMGHAFMRPSYYLDPEYRLPTVPFFVNCYYGPQPTAKRCVQLGRAVRKAIERIPLDINVAVIGSGGLWHLPNYPQSWLDEEFDANMLAICRVSASDEPPRLERAVYRLGRCGLGLHLVHASPTGRAESKYRPSKSWQAPEETVCAKMARPLR